MSLLVRVGVLVGLTTLAVLGPTGAAEPEPASGLTVRNGWYVHGDAAVWGNAQYNGWWGAYRTNITRNAPGEIGPNRTEDLGLLTDAMLEFGYPALEHNYGLWYDRRRDRHDTARHTEGEPLPPFLEQPWARSGTGRAWDGLSRYDLAGFNDWYFRRLDEFARLCGQKGAILLHSFYMQHALLETEAHYVDFPWRPVNCIQETGMPDRIPAANAFYDVSHPVRRKLHEAYIRKCLDVLGRHRNVVLLLSEEYTGPLSFLQFWLDTVRRWEEEHGGRVHVAVGATKDVLDAVLDDAERSPRVSSIDLRYWWYLPDGTLHAPPGGREVAGRYASGGESAKTTPERIYRQVLEYRRRYPDRGIIHMINASREQTWAFLMAGGSLLVRYLQYADENESRYVAPEGSEPIQGAYRFVRSQLAHELVTSRPLEVASPSDRNWCLGSPGVWYLVYSLRGGRFSVDLSEAKGRLVARWVDPTTGEISSREPGVVQGGGTVVFETSEGSDRALWIRRADT